MNTLAIIFLVFFIGGAAVGTIWLNAAIDRMKG